MAPIKGHTAPTLSLSPALISNWESGRSSRESSKARVNSREVEIAFVPCFSWPSRRSRQNWPENRSAAENCRMQNKADL